MSEVLKKEAIFRWVIPAIRFLAILFTLLIIALEGWVSYWMMGLSIGFQLAAHGMGSYTRMLLRTELESGRTKK